MELTKDTMERLLEMVQERMQDRKLAAGPIEADKLAQMEQELERSLQQVYHVEQIRAINPEMYDRMTMQMNSVDDYIGEYYDGCLDLNDTLDALHKELPKALTAAETYWNFNAEYTEVNQ